ncbi:uncharacterized protein [Spinacia oleracea]|uniref:Uncharacterized protein isoform X2 n=1 Tax=Spinacia oleracea TaxID=3562 RepID=A0ABM3QUR8_SPIOL|nr:uncharacterized protein LOC110786371 isoform X2 [Spinacia oleracea]
MADSLPSSKRRRTDHPEAQSDTAVSSNLKNLSPLVVFAHGAGAPSSSDWMIRWKEMLGKALQAVEVVTFDYPYLACGKKGVPPKAERLVDFHADVVRKAVDRYPDHPLILAGKSMGARDRKELYEMRYWFSSQFLSCLCSKDGLCPLDKLKSVRKRMKSINDLHVIDGGDHSFKIAKKHLQATEATQNDAEESAVQSIASFISNSLFKS